MRYAFAIAGLAVAAQAGGNTYTLTATEEVTITSCAPTHTNCPYKTPSNDWENWQADPTTTTTWGTWDPSKPSTTPKKPAESTWSAWDPAKPSTTTTTTWGTWDPSKETKTTTSTWGSWDPSKPSTSAKPTTKSGEWNDWDNGSDGKKTTSSKSATATGGWNDWENGSDGKKTTSSKPATATGKDGEWNNWGSTTSKPVSNTAACPSYTATAPPAWFSQLPSAVLSSLAAQWTGAPPKDWCYYSYSVSTIATKTPDAATGASNGEWNNWGAATSTPVKGASATGTGPVAKYTGAANANTASFVLGGAAAIAAIILV